MKDMIIKGTGDSRYLKSVSNFLSLYPDYESFVAALVAGTEIPIISAVGHETDFTIADFVADLRAPTPSAAGELAVPELNELKWKISNSERQLCVLLNKKVEIMRNKYNSLKNSRVLKDPFDIIRQRTITVQNFEKQLIDKVNLELKDNKIKLISAVSKLDTLSPLKTLTRGYAILEKEDRSIITSVDDVKSGDIVKVVLQDGEKKASIL